MSAPERIRRAIALLSQARAELMVDDVYDYLDPNSRAGITGTVLGGIRLRLQLELRARGEVENLEGGSSLENVLASRGRE